MVFFFLKHLEDELSATKAELANLKHELYVQHGLYEEREGRLLEADAQLGVLQKEWVAVQEVTQKEMMTLTKRCQHLAEVNTFSFSCVSY